MAIMRINDVRNGGMSSQSRVYVVTGADSGLGRAVANRLRSDGTVISCGTGPEVDIRADLTTPSGRTSLVQEVYSLAGSRLDGVVAVAGMGAHRAETVALNHFGTVAVLEGLREALTQSPAPAVVVVSSASTLNRGSMALVRACLRDDEAKALDIARRLMRTGRGGQLYRSSKIALNHWTRRAAVQARWAGRGIVLNAVAPGVIGTELVMQNWERERLLLETALPQPLGMPGPVEPVAELLAYAVSPSNRFMTGQVIYCDGGADALSRKLRPQQVYLRYGLRDVVTMLRESRRLARRT